MTVDDATVRDSGLVPGPRTPTRHERPWTEPSSPRGRRPRSQYWDVATARWVERSSLPGPRRGS